MSARNNVPISVIIPIYRKLETIGNTILSVVNQKYKDFEIILIDDKGGDGSVEIAKRILKSSNLNYTIIVNEKNLGPGLSRNEGAKISLGEYLVFLDADDIWYNFYLELLATDIRNNPEIDLFGYNYSLMYKNGSVKNRRKPMSGLTKFGISTNMFENCCKFPTQTSFIAIKKTSFFKFGSFTKDYIGEDLELFYSIFLYGKNFFRETICGEYNFDFGDHLSLNTDRLSVFYSKPLPEVLALKKKNMKISINLVCLKIIIWHSLRQFLARNYKISLKILIINLTYFLNYAKK